MWKMLLATALGLFASLLYLIPLMPSPAIAHGFVSYVVADSKLYWGWNPWFPHKDIPRPPPYKPENAIGWPNDAVDAGYVWPSRYDHPDIICHRGAKPAAAHVPVKAGSTLHVQWKTWPDSHSGPLLTYMAPCIGTSAGCADVDPTELRFIKIDDSSPGFFGYDIEPEGYLRFGDRVPSGTWATHVLIARNLSWQVSIPEGLPPGPYVMRHEALNLEYAAQEDFTQHFTWCLNLWVTGESDDTSAFDLSQGVPAMGMYKIGHPGLNLDIYKRLEKYDIPGPALAVGAKPIPLSGQRPQAITGLGTPVRISGTTAEPWANDEEAAYRFSLVMRGEDY